MSLDVTLTVNRVTVWDSNITHNLGKMAVEAGIYKPLWCPDKIGITKAVQLIEPLTAGLALLESDPHRFRKFNPGNGWGTYEDFLSFVRSYIEACRKYPDADVKVSR